MADVFQVLIQADSHRAGIVAADNDSPLGSFDLVKVRFGRRVDFLEANLSGPLTQYPGSQFPGRAHVRIGTCPEQEQSRESREQITV